MFTKTLRPQLACVGLLVALFCGVAYGGQTPVAGYLTAQQAPDSLAILPPPPALDSPAFARDRAAYEEGLKLRNTPRGAQAANDADLSDGNLGKPFSAAVGVAISAQNTPQTFLLLQQLRADSGGAATKSAKSYYQRTRPFAFFNVHSCTPNDDAILRKNGSYPSGHTAFGWSTALVLAEIVPERQNEILKRGYEFGQSRVICGAHWQSDVDSGRLMGAAAVARLQAVPAFQKQFQKARQELRGELAGSQPVSASGALSAAGRKERDFFNASQVDDHWQMGFHVNWETGEAISVSKKPTTTHCSAYVAALLKREGIYILRPPKHEAKNLANAQFDYLLSDKGHEAGWRELGKGYPQVQALANDGYFVVAVVKNDDPAKPGHIAFIYPQASAKVPKSLADLQVAQAGHVNGVDMPLLKGFEKHQKEIGEGRIKFFYNVQQFG